MKLSVFRKSGKLIALYPTFFLVVFFLIPFAIMLTVSFFHRVEGAFFEPAFEFDNYLRFFDPFYLGILQFSILLSVSAAVLATAVAFPFTYMITRMSRRAQVVALVLLLAVLSLSEVIIGFSWSTLLSRTSGISNLFVSLGLLEKPTSYYPSLPAVLIGLVYLSFPYAVLVLYPPLSRLDPELPEAARMMGASPMRTFFTIIIPLLRRPIISTLILVFVFTLGAYTLPQTLGKPSSWTLSVHITDQAIFQANLPFAAAMAVFLLIVTLAMIAVTSMLDRTKTEGNTK